MRDGLPGVRVLGKQWSLRVSLGCSTERGRWVLPSARLLQRPSFDESRKRALKVGGLEVGKGDILVLSCSWGVCASEGRISNPGHLPSFKSYLNCRTWSCPTEDCLKIAPGAEGSSLVQMREKGGVPWIGGKESRDRGGGAPELRGRASRNQRMGVLGPSRSRPSPACPDPALTVHAGEGQRLRPKLLLHRDLQVELDVVHAGDDFLHGGGGGGGHTGPAPDQIPCRPHTSNRCRPRSTRSSTAPPRSRRRHCRPRDAGSSRSPRRPFRLPRLGQSSAEDGPLR